MPKSKVDKKRKSKKQQFKNKKKKQHKMKNEIKQPTSFGWNPDDKITITGEEFAILNGFVKQFEMPLAVANNIFGRMVKSGIAKPQFDNKEVDVQTVPHIVTEEDLTNNPELVAQGVQVGDEIRIPLSAQESEIAETDIKEEVKQGASPNTDTLEEDEAEVEEDSATETDSTSDLT